MSDTSNTEKEIPSLFPVQVHPGYPVLPPILSTDQSITQEKSTFVNGFWAKLREHISSERLKTYDGRGIQNTQNKVVRIFVSSTFTDFFNEREVLIKKVFTALREEMEPVGIQIVDCDLRWGVPKDSTSEQTILACLEELDRCIEDNGQPFFIGLTSDKYGWVPKLADLPKTITETYSWIDGASITLMEFLHGAFRRNNPNAFFLIRKSENILQNLPKKYTDKFQDKDEMSRKQVEQLKIQLPEIMSPEQVFCFDCSYSGIDSSSGRERIKIDGLQEFEVKAKSFLSEAIRKWYPENFHQDNSNDKEQKQMSIFLHNNIQYYVHRSDEYATLLKYITGDHDQFTIIQENLDSSAAKVEGQPLLILSSQQGEGKTTLLAKFVLEIQENLKDTAIVFYYFTQGDYLDATHFIMTNLKRKLLEYVDEHCIKSPRNDEKFNMNDDDFLTDVISSIKIPIIIVVDGLERGDLRDERNYEHEFPFLWLRYLASDHTFIIVSTKTDSNLHMTIRHRPHYLLELKPLISEQRSSFIDMFFQSYNKKLESDQKLLLVNNKGGEHPMFLSYICENLRRFGDYSLVTKRLEKYPDNLNDLMNFLLDEAYETIENRELTDSFFKLLLVSGIGLVEIDVVDMLLHYSQTNIANGKQIDVNRMIWAILRRHVKIFLDSIWIIGSQYIIFRDSSIEKVIRQRCLNDNVDEIRTLHGFMAEFYRKHSSLKYVATSRILYHYEQAHMYQELVAYLHSTEGRIVARHDRENYLRRRRCTNTLGAVDTQDNQCVYVCIRCAKGLRLPMFMTQKSPCVICSKHVPPSTPKEVPLEQRRARLCQKHGTSDYSKSFQCAVCRKIEPTPSSQPLTPGKDPLPLYFCCECWIASGSTDSRCSAFSLD